MKVELYTLDNDLICQAEIYERTRDHIKCKTETMLLEYQYKEIIAVLFDETEGVLKYKASVQNYDLNGNGYNIKIGTFLSQTQRRSDIKVKTNFLVDVISKISAGNEESINIHAHVDDISAGGIKLTIPKENEFEIGDILKLIIEEFERPIELKCEILRKDLFEELYFCYGCRFVDSKVGVESVIRKYVFDQQRKIKRKWKFM